MLFLIKQKFFKKHPSGIVRHNRLPNAFVFRRSDNRTIAVWHDGINYDRNSNYIVWRET